MVGNIRELVERLFEQHASALDTALGPPSTTAAESRLETVPAPVISSEQTSTTSPSATATDGSNDLPEPATDSPPVQSHRQQQRQDRFTEVRRLHRNGRRVRQIARELQMSRGTVINYLHRERCPNWNPGSPRTTRLDHFQAQVDAFIREGGRTATVLDRRLKDQGCDSSYDAARRFLTRRLQAAGIAPAHSSRGPPRPRRPSARQLSFEFVRRAENRSEDAVERMRRVNPIPELCGPLALATELLAMTRGELKTALTDWLDRADGSASGSVQSFAETLRTDATAVKAALSTRWSNGPVEGQVNRLKLIKRSMFGRAGLPLLRARACAKS